MVSCIKGCQHLETRCINCGRLANSATIQPQWIKCSDRLPPSAKYEDCQRYLIWIGYQTNAYWMNDEWLKDTIEPSIRFKPSHWRQELEAPND